MSRIHVKSTTRTTTIPAGEIRSAVKKVYSNSVTGRFRSKGASKSVAAKSRMVKNKK
ncbi:MAG: hypothetical protein WKF85_04270 [Chitinophagaceae bacterium]